MQNMPVLLAYFGPETMMPMTSIIATAAAVVMMFGRTIVRIGLGLVRSAWYGVRRKNATPAPHFAIGHHRSHGMKPVTSAYVPDEEQ
jgi:hypothetical protein